MKKLILVFCIFFTFQNLFSQITGEWESVDSSYLKVSYIPNVDQIYYINQIDMSKDNTIAHIFGIKYYPGIRFSSDFGQTWKTIYYDTLDKDKQFISIYHPNKNKVIMHGRFNANTTQFIYTTSDCGAKWNKTMLDTLCGLTNISMIDSLRGATVKFTLDKNKKKMAKDSIYITKDCWHTWESIETPSDFKSIHYIYYLKNDCYVLYGYDSNYMNFIMKTNDNASTWKKNTNPEVFTGIAKLNFINDSLVWLVGGNQYHKYPFVYNSTDGGVTWKLNFIDDKSMDVVFNDIKFYDENNGLLVGDFNRIFRTTDGGYSWFREYYKEDYQYSHNPEKIILADTISLIYQSNSSLLYRNNNQKSISPPYVYIPMYPQSPENAVLNLGKVIGADKYRIQLFKVVYDKFSSSNDTLTFNAKPVVDTVFADTTIILKKLDYAEKYRIKAKSIKGNQESIWNNFVMNWFSVLKYKGQLLTPEIINPQYYETINTRTPVINWKAVDSVKYYHLILYKKGSPYITIINDSLIEQNNYFVKDSLQPGTAYTLSLRAYNGANTSDRIYIPFYTNASSALSYFEVTQEISGLLTHPNPTSDNLKISVLDRNIIGEDIVYDVYSVEGIKVITSHINLPTVDGKFIIDVSGIASGVYFLRIRDKVAKFLKY